MYFIIKIDKREVIMKKVLVLLAEGFEEMEAIICIDMFRRAGLDTFITSTTESKTVEGSRKIKINSDILLENLDILPDAIVLPGGMPGAENLAKSKKAKELIRKTYESNNLVAAICASPVIVLAPMGILNYKMATCYPGFEKDFDPTTKYIDKKVVLDKNIITSKGPGTSFAFTLEIIKYLCGGEKADLLKKQTLIN